MTSESLSASKSSGADQGQTHAIRSVDKVGDSLEVDDVRTPLIQRE